MVIVIAKVVSDSYSYSLGRVAQLPYEQCQAVPRPLREDLVVVRVEQQQRALAATHRHGRTLLRVRWGGSIGAAGIEEKRLPQTQPLHDRLQEVLVGPPHREELHRALC